MTVEKQRLIEQIEEARARMNASIAAHRDYEIIYQNSVDLDRLIEQYIVAGY